MSLTTRCRIVSACGRVGVLAVGVAAALVVTFQGPDTPLSGHADTILPGLARSSSRAAK
jgi:hypothetical protein